MNANQGNRENPYVGPRAFTKNEILYGRDRERRNLFNLLIAERLVMLYAPSGAGKSSLIQAGLIPDLEKANEKRPNPFYIFPLIWVGQAPVNTEANRYILSTLLSLEQNPDIPDLAKLDFKHYFEKRQTVLKNRKYSVFIFDQFEEILTVDPTDQDKKIEFFTQLGEFLQDRNRWALFALREDHIAGLNPFLHLIPTRLKTTFRLNLLEEKTAFEAVLNPAKKTDVQFDTEAANKLVKDLLKDGFYVEPVQLQVVCRRLWDKKISEGVKWIRDTDIKSGQTVDEALSTYYNNQIRAIVDKTKIDEITIRDWFDQKLITPQGIRSQAQEGQAQNDEFEEEVIPKLIDAHLVRSEKRNNIIWYELTHDRLIKPIQETNAKWRDDNLTVLQRQALNWDKAGRSDGLLLRGRLLKEAEEEPKRIRLSNDIDNDFLEKCKQIRKQKRVVLGLAILLSVLVLALACIFYFLYIEARKQEAEARKQTLITKAEISKSFSSTGQIKGLIYAIDAVGSSLSWFPNFDPPAQVRSSLLLAIQKIRERTVYQTKIGIYMAAISADGQTVASLGSGGKIYLLANNGYWLNEPFQFPGEFKSIAISANGKLMVSLDSKDFIQVWSQDEQRDGQWVSKFIKPQPYPSSSVAISGDGQIVASMRSNEIILLRLDGTQLGKLKPLSGVFRSIAISADGQNVVSSGYDGWIQIWSRDKQKDKKWVTMKTIKSDSGKSIAISADGQTVVEGDMNDGLIKLWSFDGSLLVGSFRHEGGVKSVAISADGQTVVSLGSDGIIHFWDQNGEELGDPIQQNTAFDSIAITADGQTVAATNSYGDSFGYIRFLSSTVWPVGKSLKHPDAIESIAISGDGRIVITLDYGGRMYLQLKDGQDFMDSVLPQSQNEIDSIAISADGKTVAILERNNGIMLWLLGTKRFSKIFEDSSKIDSIAISTDGQTIVGMMRNGLIQRWSSTGLRMGAPIQNNDRIKFMAISANSQTIASVDLNNVLRFYGHDNRLLGSAKSQDEINSLAISADGNTAVSGHNDFSLKLWSSDGRLLKHFEHPDMIKSVAISGNGETIVSKDNRNMVRLWSHDGHLLGNPFDCKCTNTQIILSSDGKVLATNSKLWLLGDWQAWFKSACDILHSHSIWKKPDSEKTETEQGAIKTCKTYFPE